MVDTTLDERIARIEKELAAIKAEVEAERQEESRPQYQVFRAGDYIHEGGFECAYPRLSYQIDNGRTGAPTIAAFRDEETANRVLAFLNQEKVEVPRAYVNRPSNEPKMFIELFKSDWEQFKAALRARGVID